ncbi:hypothetical protein JCM5350_006936 [Sporobolomyces pararoseus]
MTTESRSTKRDKKLLPLEPAPTQLSKQKTLDLPVDVWLMIAEQAHPYSLLQLSRTNKLLRRILTSKESSSAIWTRALRTLENFPNFQNADFGGPSLVAFMYEDHCAVCKKEGTDTVSHSMRIKLHRETCGDKLIMQGRKLLLKIPALRDEVLLCLPKAFVSNHTSWKSLNRQISCDFVIDEARTVNFDLHDHLSSSKGQDEASIIHDFVEEYQPRAESMEKDGENLSGWMGKQSQEERMRIVNALSTHCLVNLRVTEHWMADAIGQDWEILIRISLLSVQGMSHSSPCATLQRSDALVCTGWNKLYYKIEKLFLSYCEPAKEAQRQQQVRRRKLLHAKYSLLKDDDPLYVPFSIFTEIPSVRKLWEPENASNAAIEDEWDSQQLQVLDQHIRYAQRWFRLSVARILSRSLAQIGKPLSPQLYSSLHPDNCLLPPPSFKGIDDSSNSTGLYLHDPATISGFEVEGLLDRFSNQAWFFKSQQPRSLTSTLRDKLDRISKIDYRGPLFPKFHKFWHQILSQVLGKSGIEDDGEETELMTVTELLSHFKRHDFPSEGAPQDSLVVFHAVEAQGNDA